MKTKKPKEGEGGKKEISWLDILDDDSDKVTTQRTNAIKTSVPLNLIEKVQFLFLVNRIKNFQ